MERNGDIRWMRDEETEEAWAAAASSVGLHPWRQAPRGLSTQDWTVDGPNTEDENRPQTSERIPTPSDDESPSETASTDESLTLINTERKDEVSNRRRNRTGKAKNQTPPHENPIEQLRYVRPTLKKNLSDTESLDAQRKAERERSRAMLANEGLEDPDTPRPARATGSPRAGLGEEGFMTDGSTTAPPGKSRTEEVARGVVERSVERREGLWQFTKDNRAMLEAGLAESLTQHHQRLDKFRKEKAKLQEVQAAAKSYLKKRRKIRKDTTDNQDIVDYDEEMLPQTGEERKGDSSKGLPLSQVDRPVTGLGYQ